MKIIAARIIAIVTSITVPSVTLAADSTQSLVTKGACESGFSNCNDSLFGTGSLVSNVTNTLIFLVGAISVIMIVVGGLRMTLSAGNPANIKSARETVIYAVVGVVIAIFSYAIVHYVILRTA